MTKKEIQTIQAAEAAANLELAIYDSLHAPADGDDNRVIDWESNDEGHKRYLAAWCAIYELMEALGIEVDYQHPSNAQASELSCELFFRRQAAKGITYDAEGNEICA